MLPAERQRLRDEEHVRLLGIFYYVSGGITAVYGLFPLMYVAMGAMFMNLPDIDTPDGEFVTRSMGGMMVGLGLTMFVFAQGFAAIKILCGYWLLRKRNRIACLVIGGIICIGIPFSTVLGIFTFTVLLRDSVRDLFANVPVDTSQEVEPAT